MGSPQDYARSKTNSCWTTYTIQGFCCYWRLQWTRWSWSKVFQGSGYRHSWCHYLGKIIHHSSSKRFLGKQNRSPSHCSLQSYRKVRFHLGTFDSCTPWNWYCLCTGPKKNFCKWLELKIVILLPVDQLALWAISLRQLTLQLPKPMPTCPQIYGKKLSSQNRHTRNSLIIWPKTIDRWLLNAKK